MIFPWQTQQWQQLWQANHAKRLPHALLLSGNAGLGKKQFADTFARTLLCAQVSKQGFYCGQCHSCRLAEGKSHPGIMWVEPEKPGQAIKVDQIREISEFASQTALLGEMRIVIIHPAQQMNINAANALLKTLEEPSSSVLIILVGDQIEQLPATILSRCQRMVFTPPLSTLALAWLRQQAVDKKLDLELILSLAKGAPLAALQWAQEDVLALRSLFFDNLLQLEARKTDPLHVAKQLQETTVLQLIDWMLSWIMDLIKLRLEVPDILNKDYQSHLVASMQRQPVAHLTKMMEYLCCLRNQIERGMNLNQQLVTENILIRWLS